MTILSAVRNRIRELCQQREITFNHLARLSAMPPTTLKHIMYGDTNPTIKTIKMLCDGLGITITEFFDTDEFRGLEPEIK